jgi:uncharacterized protein YbaP (TraB family)
MKSLSELPEDKQAYLLGLIQHGVMPAEAKTCLPDPWVAGDIKIGDEATDCLPDRSLCALVPKRQLLTKRGFDRLLELAQRGRLRHVEQARQDANAFFQSLNNASQGAE